MSEWLDIAKAFAPGAILGVVVGYYLSRSEQRRLFRARMLDRSLEKVYGPAFSIVEKPEAKVSFVEGSREPGIMLWENEYNGLWEAMMNYPHLLTDEIRQYWLANLKDLRARPMETDQYGKTEHSTYYPIRPEFREMVRQEYNRRLKEYRKLTGDN